MAPFFVHQEFLNYLSSEKRFSEHTCVAYKKDINQFLEHTGVLSYSELKEIDSKLVRGWIVNLIEEDYASTSVNRKISSLRTYFKWLVKVNAIDYSPMQTVQGPKVSKNNPSFAQQKELTTQKMSSLFGGDFDGLRDCLMFEFFYQTGIRSSELVSLKDKDVNFKSIKVLGKRNKERLIPISTQLFELIQEYRVERDQLMDKSEMFFLLNNGKKLYPKFVYRKINNYLSKATGLEKKSPHVLRHTFATHLLNNGAGLEVLKELLGHASLSATQIYTHNSFAELTNIYSQSHPRGHKKE